MRVELYTRTGCHLCDEAEQLLRDCGLAVVTIDIAARKDLLAKYNTCVPVIVIDDKVRFRGRVDPMLLRRLIDHQK